MKMKYYKIKYHIPNNWNVTNILIEIETKDYIGILIPNLLTTYFEKKTDWPRTLIDLYNFDDIFDALVFEKLQIIKLHCFSYAKAVSRDTHDKA